MRPLFLLLPLALFGCGNSAPDGAASDADWLADQVKKECTSSPAPTPKQARDLTRICACWDSKIRSSGIKRADGEAAKDEMLDRTAEACLRRVYGSTR